MKSNENQVTRGKQLVRDFKIRYISTFTKQGNVILKGKIISEKDVKLLRVISNY